MLEFSCCILVADVLRFDNKYSWTRTKIVHYNVRVEMEESAEAGKADTTAAAASPDSEAGTAPEA